MIQYNPKNWFRHIFMFHRADTLRKLLPEIMIVAAYTALLAYGLPLISDNLQEFKSALAVHSLIGFIMGLLLVFRTNTAYERWWEGRKAWGALVNHSRNLAMKCKNFIGSDELLRKGALQQLIVAYPYAMKEHLRKGVDLSRLLLPEEFANKLADKKHIPNAIASQIYYEINKLYKEGHISGEQLILLDNELRAYTDMVGVCERIKGTPIPFSYSLFIKKFIFIYTSTLPLGLIPDFGFWSVPVSVFVFYVMVSLELLAEEIEDPFGSDDNDLPSDELSGKIEASTGEIFRP